MARLRPVLLVEDSVDDQALAREAFQRAGVDNPIAIAPDGRAALDWLLAALDSPHEYDLPALILLDINLPVINGVEVLRRLRAHPQLSTLPVVMLSNSREPRDLRDCYRAGANAYICKPIEFAAFLQVVQKLADFWLRLNEMAPDELSRVPD
jgi:CheY-like chemotaxis protein